MPDNLARTTPALEASTTGENCGTVRAGAPEWLRVRAIRTKLSRLSGDESDPAAVAGAALVTWNEVAAQLAPVIGGGGVEALFRRALHLTARALPWLADEPADGDIDASLARFKARLAKRDAAGAMEASLALLATFTALLASLIGDSLTDRLLISVWAPLETEEDAS